MFGGKPGSPAELTIDDSMWAQKGFPLYKTFLDAIAQYFGAGVNLVDFRANPDAARLAINRYVNIKTQGLILNLLPPGIVDKYTVFTLMNTLTFKGHGSSRSTRCRGRRRSTSSTARPSRSR